MRSTAPRAVWSQPDFSCVGSKHVIFLSVFRSGATVGEGHSYREEAMADERFDGLKLLGQELTWPRTIWGTLAVFFIVTGICVIVFTIVRHARELEPVFTTFMATRVDKGSVVET